MVLNNFLTVKSGNFFIEFAIIYEFLKYRIFFLFDLITIKTRKQSCRVQSSEN